MNDEHMKDCPICKSRVRYPNEECICGYNWKKAEVTNFEKIQISFSQLPIKTKWLEKSTFLNSFHKIQQKTHSKWSYDKTAEILSVSRSTVWDMINLADGLADYPELSWCTSYDKAKKLLKDKKKWRFISWRKFPSEKDLQEYMETHWDKTPFAQEWEITEKKVDLQATGEIDLLAKHKNKKKWLIIELKKGKSSDDAVGQTLRYMGWVKENRANEDEEVEGVIISGPPPDDNIRLALLFAPAVQYRVYYLEGEKDVRFLEKDDLDLLLEFQKLSLKEQKQLAALIKLRD